MSWESADRMADALLYEGYLLYPYRDSALKNRYRWQFGVLAPRAYVAADGSESSLMQTECLLEPGEAAAVDVKVRFLQVEARRVERLVSAPNGWETIDSLTVAGQELVTWDEAVPRELVLPRLSARAAISIVHRFVIDGGREHEAVANAVESRVRVVRERWPIACTIEVTVAPLGSFRRLTVRIANVTDWPEAAGADRPAALRRSLIATHTLLAVTDGAFISMLDPPSVAAAGVAACENLRSWPVLVGQAPERSMMLSSPIILYDYPQIAPESPGDQFDATEIDELLTLSVLALTDEERRQARATDPRAAQLIDRATNLAGAERARLHGAVRHMGGTSEPAADAPVPAARLNPIGAESQAALETWLNPPGSDAATALDAAGRPICQGSRVRLRPNRHADAMDLFLAEQTATVAAVYRDVDDAVHVAVIVDAARAGDLHECNGRFYYFSPDEIDVIASADASSATRARLLVAGIGNVFLGDDGFGSAVVERLVRRPLPDWVRVEDFGIRSVHLAYDLLDASYETTILIDAMGRGGVPGTLYVLEPEPSDTTASPPDAHALGVEDVLGFLTRAGADPGRVVIVGCEPLSVAPAMGLSDVVASTVAEAADLVMHLITGTEA